MHLQLPTPARLTRFTLVGSVCGLLQLALLAVLLIVGVSALPANLIAFLTSAQANFALSNFFIWRDRRARVRTPRRILKRWSAFHASIAATFLLSQAVFLLARLEVPVVMAAGLGLGTSAMVNFLLQDRLTFTPVEDRGLISSAARIRRLRSEVRFLS